MRSVCIKFPSLGKRLLYCGSRKKELFTRERNKCTSTRVWGLIKSLTYVSLNKNWLTFPWTQDDNWPHIRRSEHVQDFQFKHLLKLAFLSWKQTNKKKQFWGILFSIRTIKILARLSFHLFSIFSLYLLPYSGLFWFIKPSQHPKYHNHFNTKTDFNHLHFLNAHNIVKSNGSLRENNTLASFSSFSKDLRFWSE